MVEAPRCIRSSIPADFGSHRVTHLLRLAGALGLAPVPEIVCPTGVAVEEVAPPRPYAVVHASPFYRYKRWTDAGWRGLARGLAERGLAVIATEGPDPAERAYMDALVGSRRGAGDPAQPRLAAPRGAACAVPASMSVRTRR